MHFEMGKVELRMSEDTLLNMTRLWSHGAVYGAFQKKTNCSAEVFLSCKIRLFLMG